jgi:hypothetical protein
MDRKTELYHYWRGFKACAVIALPVIAFFAVCAYYLITNIK